MKLMAFALVWSAVSLLLFVGAAVSLFGDVGGLIGFFLAMASCAVGGWYSPQWLKL